MSLNEQYSCLKAKICQLAIKRPYSLQQVKDFYKDSINSKRSLSRVKNLDCIFRLLEERSLLNERNVTALRGLGELLNNPDVTNWIQVYIKNYETDTICNICGSSCDYKKFSDSSSTIQQNSNHNNNVNSNYYDELGQVLRNLSLRIGKEWKTLARHLEIKEKYIDDIVRNNPNNYACQAEAAFAIWRASAGADNSVSVLENALETRYCKIRGLGSFLLEPLISLSC